MQAASRPGLKAGPTEACSTRSADTAITTDLAGRIHGDARVVFLQLVVQRLEADAEDFGGARLVVVGGFERLPDEEHLGLLDGRADAYPHGVGFLQRRAGLHLAESRRQVADVDDRAF